VDVPLAKNAAAQLKTAFALAAKNPLKIANANPKNQKNNKITKFFIHFVVF
jgi:hypothetical protein